MNSENAPETVADPDVLTANAPFLRPDWVPEQGHGLRLAGVHFDAVAVRGCRGEEIMAALLNRQGWAAGPIVHAAANNEVTFILPVNSADAYKWPVGPDFLVLTGAKSRRYYVGIPALDGATWPLLWRSIPTAQAPFVCAATLYAVAGGRG